MVVSDPKNKDVEFRQQEERSEDCLVVSSQPQRQVDVKVISALIRVPLRDPRERTTPAIERRIAQSISTVTVKVAAQRNSPLAADTGTPRMHPTKKTQTAV